MLPDLTAQSGERVSLRLALDLSVAHREVRRSLGARPGLTLGPAARREQVAVGGGELTARLGTGERLAIAGSGTRERGTLGAEGESATGAEAAATTASTTTADTAAEAGADADAVGARLALLGGLAGRGCGPRW